MATSVEVLVIGAGAAGLTAAYDLKRNGVNVTILEAGSCLGGRLQKLESFAEFPIDLGGGWIHNVGPGILDKLVDDPTVKVDVKTTRYDVKRIMGYKASGEWVPIKCDLSSDFKFSGSTWYDFFHDYIGMSVNEDIRFTSVVKSIDYTCSTDVGQVNVVCQDGSIFRADQVIVAIPLSILQDGDITFNPLLSEATLEALKKVAFISGVTVFMEFGEKFYYDAFGFFSDYEGYSDDRGERYCYDETYAQETTKHIMGIKMVGDPAQRFLALEDDEIVQELLRELDTAYDGAATRTYVKSHVHNWYNQSYARGAYSSYDHGTKPMVELRKTLDRRVFFAGEHLPWDGKHFGSVHSAALSGRAAATAVSCVRDGKDPPVHRRRTCLACTCCFSM